MKKIGANTIASELRRGISQGILMPGDRLAPERVLADQFMVARGTVRSAIRQLEDEGLVEVRAGSGSYVADKPKTVEADVISNASPLELIDARFALEPHTCRLAVLNAKPSDFQHLDALLAQMDAAVDDPVRFSELDTEWHSYLAQTTGNHLLIWIVSQINFVRNQEQWKLMRHLTLDSSTIQTYNTQHRQIVDAIRAREPERAAQLMKKHLETARLSLTRSAAT
jgi:GntR family uxuAB operon transcriptional repressor